MRNAPLVVDFLVELQAGLVESRVEMVKSRVEFVDSTVLGVAPSLRRSFLVGAAYP